MSQAEVARRRDRVELRIANLRRELGAETAPRLRAAILYQVGTLYEQELDDVPQAMSQYGQARDEAPAFQPALIAELRIAERARNGYDLAALRSEQVARASSPALSAAALVDLAMCSEDWGSLLREAIARSPEPGVPALLLEWLAEARGDQAAVGDALRTQAGHARDQSLRGALWIDVALHELQSGNPDEAIAALERACESDAVAWQARSLQARAAREHERWDVFVRASTSMAALLEAAAERGEASSPLSLSVPQDERLPMAAYLLEEAAACCATRLEDLEAALGYLDSALRLFPNRKTARLQSLLTAELLGDAHTIEQASVWFEQNEENDPAFVAHEIRRALAGDSTEVAVDTLREALARFPDSVYARSALEVALIRGERYRDRADAFERAAGAAEGESRARLLWRAAQLEAIEPTRSAEAQALFEQAFEASESSKETIAREALGAAMRAKDGAQCLALCRALSEQAIEPKERALLAHCEYELGRTEQAGAHQDEGAIRDAALEPSNRAWAPQLARAIAAWSDNPLLLGEAHERIAELASGETRLGHLCAAGPAYARAGNWEAAERVLRAALKDAPDDLFALSLLDGVLREGGRTEDVVSLARARAQTDSQAALGELSLLLAGATAERSGNLGAARQAYEQALEVAPDSPSAALALLDIGHRERNEEATLRAYLALSESDSDGGLPELYAILRGDALGSKQDAEAGRAYARALDAPASSIAAAVSLLTLPSNLTDADQRLAAQEVLADADETTNGGDGAFAVAYSALRAAFGGPTSSTEDAWLTLSALAPTDALRAGTLLQGLRATALSKGPAASDETFLRAQEASGMSTAQPEASSAIDEALAPGDDAELRVLAIEAKLGHSGTIGRTALEGAHARALIEAGRGADAVSLLSAAVDDRPDDLALWEALRSAARQAEQWPLVAQACERMSPFVEGSLSGDLLEEAGVVRMDHLQQYQQAEDLFRRALEEDPEREIAFRRLRDLLVAHEDAEGLEEIVSQRLAVGGPKDRLALLYERARLLRGFSDRPGALEALGELFTEQPDHSGALALAAEVHVTLEQWSDAVDCLRRLARSDVPNDQRRVAHLGAADFLEAKLGAKDEALVELRAVEALGLADAGTWSRIGALEAEHGREEAAIDAYRQALDREPVSDVAIAALAELLEGRERDSAIAKHEDAIWSRIEAGELDEALLESLRRAADWLGDEARVSAAAAVQRAFGLGQANGAPTPDLSQVSAAALWDPDAEPMLQELVLHAGPSLGGTRWRSKKASADDAVTAELDQLAKRFGARNGSVELSDELSVPLARRGRDGEINWVAPSNARTGLDARGRFIAGRLAWGAPRGAGELLDDSTERAAGALAAILRASGCEVHAGDPLLPALDVKLRRSVRKLVRQAVGDAKPSTAALLAQARSLQRSADRAGLLASGDIAAALTVLLGGRSSLNALRTTPRAIDLLRFWLDARSPLRGTNG
ncbi:MAG: hypothetical protein ACN4G0_06830 [Polyangiales bacterium]